MKFNKGDKVKLIDKKQSPLEEENWILKEKSNPNIGDVFTVTIDTDSDQNEWLHLDELTYSHPAEKFALSE